MPWLVHLYTASGAVLAFLSLEAGSRSDYRAAFAWLALATAIDASDGVLARLARVKERLPLIDGARLDDIVDYLTFVFVPLYLLAAGGFVPAGWGHAVVGAAMLASVFGFSRQDAKTSDYFFTGFPSYWNIVALYMVALGTAPALNALILAGFAVLVFVPIGWVYPSRTPTLQGLTVALGLVWGALMLLVIAQLPTPAPWAVWGSLLFPAYYSVLSFVLHARRA